MEKYIDTAGQLLKLPQEYWNAGSVQTVVVSPDGSFRRLYRLVGPDGQRLMVIEPPEDDAAGLREAHAAWKIGRHLYGLGISVPEMYGFEEEGGRLFVEDLGPHRLHDLLQESSPEERYLWYEKSIAELVRMQVFGAENFKTSWCWDTPYYDQHLMIERESGYFLRALCQDVLHLDFPWQQVYVECRLLAERASRSPTDFFLHRDFQSRNIMIKNGKVRIIDFQGGRLGPLAYDLASLLIDPYAGLSAEFQEEMLGIYISHLQEYVTYDREQFQQEYVLLALQRNLQILGAFAFLSRQRGKPFFSQFILPALYSLNSLLAKPEAADYALLRKLANQCLFHVQSAPDEVRREG